LPERVALKLITGVRKIPSSGARGIGVSSSEARVTDAWAETWALALKVRFAFSLTPAVTRTYGSGLAQSQWTLASAWRIGLTPIHPEAVMDADPEALPELFVRLVPMSSRFIPAEMSPHEELPCGTTST
jgi:hypothetical protein